MKWWYWLTVLAVWGGAFTWWALWLKRRWAAQDADAPVVAAMDGPQPARWEVCEKCKGLGEVRVSMGAQGSFPMKCADCLGDGCVPVYNRRASDHIRPMGVLRDTPVPGVIRPLANGPAPGPDAPRRGRA